MHRRIPPTLVEEPAGAVEVLEVSFVGGRAPKGHIGDFEVGPEVAGGVAVGFEVVVRSPISIGEPLIGIIRRQKLFISGDEFHRLGPQGFDGLGGVVEGDGEAVGFVVVAHVAEDVIVDVAEEVHVRLHAPVVLVV